MNAIRNRATRALGHFARVSMLTVGLMGATQAADGLQVDPDVLAAQQQRVQVMQKAASATVAIFGLDGGGGGSGVLVTPDGYALTNYHVSSACGDHMRCGLNDGEVYDAVIVGVDAVGDLSLIKLLGRSDFPTAPLADSDEVQVGQWCFAAGNPFVLATNLQPTVSLGLVSGVHRYQYPAGTLLEYADCIQTDAAINPGNSGGPLFNLAGEVIGINGRCSFEKRGRVNVGVGYAISANQAKYFMEVLQSGRLVDHATLGATASTNDAGQVTISNISSSSDAYRRGLRFGDEVLSLADREVRTTNMFKNILGTLPQGWRVPVVVRQDGEVKTMLVRLSGVHTEQQLVQLVSPERAPGSTPDGQRDSPQDEHDGEEAEEADDTQSDAATEDSPYAPDFALVASQLESRRGFANYHFNRQWRDRLWQQIRDPQDFTASEPQWLLRGQLAGEPTPVEISLGTDVSVLRIGSRELELDHQASMSETIGQRRETGLLVALRAYQQFLRGGPEQLGATTYMGAYPVYLTSSTRLREQPRHHLLRTAWYDAQVRTYVAPEAGFISLVEVFGDAGDDPVELMLGQPELLPVGDSEDSILFPKRLRLQYGQEPVLLIDLESVSLRRSGEGQAGEEEQLRAEEQASEEEQP